MDSDTRLSLWQDKLSQALKQDISQEKRELIANIRTELKSAFFREDTPEQRRLSNSFIDTYLPLVDNAFTYDEKILTFATLADYNKENLDFISSSRAKNKISSDENSDIESRGDCNCSWTCFPTNANCTQGSCSTTSGFGFL
ncbi:MAG: bacteriocin fulvocin C-related protein [Bacteroidota bacterium]